MDSQRFLCFLLVQSLTAFLATPTEIPHAGSGPMIGCSDPVLANKEISLHIYYIIILNKKLYLLLIT
jgi:hypothetical protein